MNSNVRKNIIFTLILASFFIFHNERVLASELVVSEQFGDVLFEKEIDSGKQPVLKVLKEQLEVQTKFGGGYVSSIGFGKKTLEENNGRYWFYYVNGILASVGAQEYVIQPSDKIWWDYHRWQGERLIGAIIGDWPEPFVSGYAGKTFPAFIWAAEGFKEDAEKLASVLREKGAASVNVDFLLPAHSVDVENTLPIYVGSWPELQKIEAVSELFKHGEKLGLFVSYENGKLIPLDWKGEAQTAVGPASAIFALKPGMDQVNPLWIITGTDSDSVRKALNILINEAERVKQRSGVIVTDQSLINVPTFD